MDSKVYIPLLDDPITERDLNEAMKDGEKGVYDYNVSILNILIINMLPLLTLLLNCLFYISYPLKLARPLLITISKVANLKLPCNFRGIQMLPAIGMLYDRIITKRLERWVDIPETQNNNKTSRKMGRYTRNTNWFHKRKVDTNTNIYTTDNYRNYKEN